MRRSSLPSTSWRSLTATVAGACAASGQRGDDPDPRRQLAGPPRHHFFAVDYQISPRTRDADDGLRRLMRQLLVSSLVNHPGHYRLEANRWLSEIALLLATRFSQPIVSMPRRDSENGAGG